MRTLLATFGLLIAATSSALAADFIGPESCRTCHPAAYEQWKKTPHARAMDALTPQQKRDPRCVSCHSPDESRGVSGVSCESCHGGGQYYYPSYVMKDPELARAVGLVDPSQKMCVKCHDANAPSLKPFDFAARLKAIDHWTVEREAKKAAAPAPAPKKK
ncbi:MAG: cytochrome c family protein [Myxococcales bacterium]